MKMPDTVTLEASDLIGNRNLVFKVRYSGPLRFRFWLASIAVRFGAWLIGGTADVARVERR